MKTLIVYYSFTQNNEKLAKHLHALLNCDIVRIETVKKRSAYSIFFDLMFHRKPAVKAVPYYLRDYDRVIFLAPIWGGQIAMPLQTFLLKEKSNIKRYSFITLCGGTLGQKEKIEKQLLAMLDIAPDHLIELWINNLLPVDKKDTIKYTSGYRIGQEEIHKFDHELDPVVKADLREVG